MTLPFSLFLALKYLKPKRTFLSVVTVISVLGVLLGVAVLIIVLSVMSGFDDMWRDKILSFNAHLTVGGWEVIENEDELVERLRQIEGVTGAAPYVQGLVFVQHDDRVYTPLVRGHRPGAGAGGQPDPRAHGGRGLRRRGRPRGHRARPGAAAGGGRGRQAAGLLAAELHRRRTRSTCRRS